MLITILCQKLTILTWFHWVHRVQDFHSLILSDPKTIVMIITIVNQPTNQPSVILNTKQNVMHKLNQDWFSSRLWRMLLNPSHTGTTQSDDRFRFWCFPHNTYMLGVQYFDDRMLLTPGVTRIAHSYPYYPLREVTIVTTDLNHYPHYPLRVFTIVTTDLTSKPPPPLITLCVCSP